MIVLGFLNLERNFALRVSYSQLADFQEFCHGSCELLGRNGFIKYYHSDSGYQSYANYDSDQSDSDENSDSNERSDSSQDSDSCSD
jgi:hypothetical protein